nr:putative glycosyltransferase [Quercus suber]
MVPASLKGFRNKVEPPIYYLPKKPLEEDKTMVQQCKEQPFQSSVSIEKLQEAILKTQKNAKIQVVEDTPSVTIEWLSWATSYGWTPPYPSGLSPSQPASVRAKNDQTSQTFSDSEIEISAILAKVILSNYYDLPFNDILDWHKFAVVLKEHDVYRLKQILKDLADAEFVALHKNLVKAAYSIVMASTTAAGRNPWIFLLKAAMVCPCSSLTITLHSNA